jgi:hypothetical protein
MSGNNSNPSPPPSPTNDTQNIAVEATDKQDNSDAITLEQSTSLDMTKEPVYENNDPTIQDTTKQVLPATIEQAPKIKRFYALVVKSDGQTETIDLESTTPESAKIVIRDFRGNPEILNGPSETIDW